MTEFTATCASSVVQHERQKLFCWVSVHVCFLCVSFWLARTRKGRSTYNHSTNVSDSKCESIIMSSYSRIISNPTEFFWSAWCALCIIAAYLFKQTIFHILKLVHTSDSNDFILPQNKSFSCSCDRAVCFGKLKFDHDDDLCFYFLN